VTVAICESYLSFNLPQGSRHHEDVNPNDIGVDFEIATTTPLWLEVKNWDAPVIPPQHRYRSDEDHRDKTNTTSSFWDAMVARFEGTYDCLDARAELPSSFRLGVLLESHLFSGMASAPLISIMQAKKKNGGVHEGGRTSGRNDERCEVWRFRRGLHRDAVSN
jgi:hypothetical protein